MMPLALYRRWRMRRTFARLQRDECAAMWRIVEALLDAFRSPR